MSRPKLLATALISVALTAMAMAKPSQPMPLAPMRVVGSIVAPGAELEPVFDRGFFLEGPSQGPDGRIYFSDITQSWRTEMTAGIIWAFDPVTHHTTLVRSPSGMSNGLFFDPEGRLLAAHGADFGARYVSRTDLATGRATILAGLYGGKPFNSPNDLDMDARGRIYFTDPRYFGHEPIEQPVQGVYRIDPGGKVELLLADVARPNGVAVSPDQASLYVTEADYLITDRRLPQGVPTRGGDMHILRYALSADGRASGRQVFVDFSAEGGGGADGIEVDRAGNLYAAVQTKRCGVRVYAPDGREIAFVPTPSSPTNLTLARVGRDVRLFITTDKVLYSIRTMVPPRDEFRVTRR